MRALTSLAGHILGSHPQVNGYYEMHLSYDDASALDAQREALLQSDGLKPNSRYLCNKLLHNDYQLKPERLGPAHLKILVSLLEPEHTIKSIVHLFAQKAAPDLYASPVEAAYYYVARVKALAEFCRTHDRGYFYFDAALLQQAPQKLLPRLTHWLELDSPLSERYAVFSQTGKARRGDSSARMQSGTINGQKTDYAHIAIPQAMLAEAQQVYQACRREMIAGAVDSISLGAITDEAGA